MLQFLVEEALMRRLDIVEAEEAKRQYELDAVAATENLVADTVARNRGKA